MSVWLMGLDVGTTGVKAAVFDEEGNLHGYGFEEYAVLSPGQGLAEQDGDAVFAAAKRVMATAAAAVGGEIHAIGLSVQGDAVTAIGQNGENLIHFHLGMDYRAEGQAEAFRQEYGDTALYALTGMRSHPMNSLCKIRWLTENQPALTERTWKYMTYADFLLYRLGADEPVIDEGMAGRTMGLRLEEGTWDADLLGRAGIGADRLSRPVPSGTVVGRLRPAVARETGIRTAPLLVAGGHDQACAALGAGLTAPGRALDSHGTAEVVSAVLAPGQGGDALYAGFYPRNRYVLPGRAFTFSLNHTAGILLRWFVEGFCGEDRVPAEQTGARLYEYVLARAGNQPAPVLVLPYFSGSGTPECDLLAKGMIVGLDLNTTRYEIARGIVEALAFDMRRNLRAMQQAGLPITELRCAGGGARSPIGLQIKADISGLPVCTLRVREAACLGAALLAGIGAGVYADGEQAAAVVATDATYEPGAQRAAYDARFALYEALYPANRDILHHLGRTPG